jgi:hypothetical protein
VQATSGGPSYPCDVEAVEAAELAHLEVERKRPHVSIDNPGRVGADLFRGDRQRLQRRLPLQQGVDLRPAFPTSSEQVL